MTMVVVVVLMVVVVMVTMNGPAAGPLWPHSSQFEAMRRDLTKEFLVIRVGMYTVKMMLTTTTTMVAMVVDAAAVAVADGALANAFNDYGR